MSQKQPSKNKHPSTFLKYSSMGFQMITTIVLGTYAGYKLDQKLDTAPIFLIVLALISVFAAMYLSLKDFIKK